MRVVELFTVVLDCGILDSFLNSLYVAFLIAGIILDSIYFRVFLVYL